MYEVEIIVLLVVLVATVLILLFGRSTTDPNKKPSNARMEMTNKGLEISYDVAPRTLTIDGKFDGYDTGVCIGESNGVYTGSSARISDNVIETRINMSGMKVQCVFRSTEDVNVMSINNIDSPIKIEGNVNAGVRGKIRTKIDDCVNVRGKIRTKIDDCVNVDIKGHGPKHKLPKTSKPSHTHGKCGGDKDTVIRPYVVPSWVREWGRSRKPRFSMFKDDHFVYYKDGEHKIIRGKRRKLEIRYGTLECQTFKPSRIMFDFLVREGSGVLIDMGSSHVTFKDDKLYIEGKDKHVFKQSMRKNKFVVCELVVKNSSWISFDGGEKHQVKWSSEFLTLGCSSMWFDINQIDIY